MVKLISYPQNEILVNGKCQNCGKLIEDSSLTHCSNVCLYEDYLKSQSLSITPIVTEDNLN